MRADGDLLEPSDLGPGRTDPSTAERATPSHGEGSDRTLNGPVSPELVLVDPGLRERLLRTAADGSATEPDRETGTPKPGPGQSDRGAGEPMESFDEPNGSSPESELMLRPARLKTAELLEPELAAGSRSTRRRWAGLGVAGLCGSLALIGVGFAIATFANFGGADPESSATESSSGKTDGPTITKPRQAPAAAGTHKSAKRPGQHAARTTVHRTKAAPSRARIAPSPRRFAWPPAPGVTAYEVAIYKNDVPVFRARTTTASIVIPERTGSSRLLVPGTYKWYVWPIHNGRPGTVALVRSTFVVPGR